MNLETVHRLVARLYGEMAVRVTALGHLSCLPNPALKRAGYLILLGKQCFWKNRSTPCTELGPSAPMDALTTQLQCLHSMIPMNYSHKSHSLSCSYTSLNREMFKKNIAIGFQGEVFHLCQ